MVSQSAQPLEVSRELVITNFRFLLIIAVFFQKLLMTDLGRTPCFFS